MTVGAVQLPGEPLVTLDVAGRPASYSTAATGPRQKTVRQAVPSSDMQPGLLSSRFAVHTDFRTPGPRNADEAWDFDNLIKSPPRTPGRVCSALRRWAGLPQPADDHVDDLTASKRTVADGDAVGAVITVQSMPVWRQATATRSVHLFPLLARGKVPRKLRGRCWWWP